MMKPLTAPLTAPCLNRTLEPLYICGERDWRV